MSVSNVNHHIMTFNVNPPPFHTRSFFNMSRVRGQSKQEQSVCRGLCEKPPQSSRMFTAQIWVDALFPLSLIVSFSASDLWHFQHSSHLLVSPLPDFNLGFQKKKKETFCTVKTTKAKKKPNKHGYRNLNDVRKKSTISTWKWERVGGFFNLRVAKEETRSQGSRPHSKNKKGCEEQSDALVMSNVFQTQRLSAATLWSAGEFVWLMRQEVERSDAASATFSTFFPPALSDSLTSRFLSSWKAGRAAFPLFDRS